MKCGKVAIVGRPNVGKSSLLNKILGFKLSITSRKPNTTRNAILGILNQPTAQVIFVDSPGWQRKPKKELSKYMNSQVRLALSEVDLILMVVDSRGWKDEDTAILEAIVGREIKISLIMNKLDLIQEKRKLLAYVDFIKSKFESFSDFFFVSAVNGKGIDELMFSVAESLPERDIIYPEDRFTDKSIKFLVGEMIREKLVRYLGDELPYETFVVVNKLQKKNRVTMIDCTVWVERDSQKGIVLGKNGLCMKKIASNARKDIERLIETRVYLNIWVKVKKGWSRSQSVLKEFSELEE